MILLKIIPVSLVEVTARLAGYIVNFRKGAWTFPTEKLVRGKYWNLIFNTTGLKIGRHVQFEGVENIQLKKGVRINCGSHIVAGTFGSVLIGEETHLAHNSLLAGGGGIKIGKRCMISSFVAVYSVTNDLNAEVPALAKSIPNPVTIGNDVFIGVGARILPGVKVGNKAIIAAGAVVINDVPDGARVKGIPAKE